jgi:hypothetical protein
MRYDSPAFVTFRLVLDGKIRTPGRACGPSAVDDARAPAGELVTGGRAYRARPRSLQAAGNLNPAYQSAQRSG